MEIQVGKKYKLICGLEVLITNRSKDKRDRYPIKGHLVDDENSKHSWSESGQKFISSIPNNYDIIEEVKDD